MHKLIYSLTAAAALFGASANAQSIILGNGIGKDCYRAVTLNDTFTSNHERMCTQAIEAFSLERRNLAASYINRGIIRMRMKNFEIAIEDYKQAQKLFPKLGAAYLNQGAAMIGAGNPEDAIGLLEKAIELKTQDIHAAYYNLGLAHELTGDVTSAYEAFQKALEVRPGWPLVIKQLERYSVVSAG